MDGPLSYSRNPMYLSWVLVLFALSVMFLSIGYFVAAVGPWVAFDRVVVAPKEACVERKFGERYARYKSRVRRWL